jgi:hypothetical protein
MRALIAGAVGVVVLAAAGCGGGTADVSGKVTYQGKPVVFGTVLVIGSDGVPKAGAIQKDGTYRVSDVKIGAAKVTVSSPPPPGARKATGGRDGRDAPDDERRVADEPVDPELVKSWFPLPERYADPAKSDLTTDVKPGQPFDIDLK